MFRDHRESYEHHHESNEETVIEKKQKRRTPGDWTIFIKGTRPKFRV